MLATFTVAELMPGMLTEPAYTTGVDREIAVKNIQCIMRTESPKPFFLRKDGKPVKIRAGLKPGAMTSSTRGIGALLGVNCSGRKLFT